MATTLSTAEPNAVEADDANAGYVYYRLTDGWIAAGEDGSTDLSLESISDTQSTVVKLVSSTGTI